MPLRSLFHNVQSYVVLRYLEMTANDEPLSILRSHGNWQKNHVNLTWIGTVIAKYENFFLLLLRCASQWTSRERVQGTKE